MYKTRLDPYPDFGKSFPYGQYSGEALYYPIVNNKTCIDDGQERMVSRFYLSPKDLTLGRHPSLGAGVETMWSTEFRPPKWNDCVHTKVNKSFSFPHGQLIRGISGWPGRSIRHLCCHRYGWTTPSHDPVLKGGYEIDDFFRSRAMASMTPRFESDFQALNFMFELKDFKEAVHALGSVMNPNSKLWDSINNWSHKYWDAAVYGGAVKPSSKKRPRDFERDLGLSAAEIYSGKATSAAAKSWLTYTMAYLPTMKDIAAYVSAAATEYQVALADFKTKGLSQQTRHYSEYLKNDSTIGTASYSDAVWMAQKLESFVKATATLRYKYQYNLSDQTEAFARYWGLTGTLEEFWNMLPGSFLFDYFCKVAKALKMSEVDKNLDFQPVEYCESLLEYQGTSDVLRPISSWLCNHIIDGKILDPAVDKWVRHCGVYSSKYQRWNQPVPKKGLIVPIFKVPSTRQNWNMLALAKAWLF